jgi:hypothetical protein
MTGLWIVFGVVAAAAVIEGLVAFLFAAAAADPTTVDLEDA